LLPKVIGLGAPKEVIPLVVMLRQKKKIGEDIGPLVALCSAAIGA
jgi:hypothetical protein